MIEQKNQADLLIEAMQKIEAKRKIDEELKKTKIVKQVKMQSFREKYVKDTGNISMTEKLLGEREDGQDRSI